MRRLEVLSLVLMAAALAAFGLLCHRGVVPYAAIGFIFVLASPAAYLYSENLAYAVVAVSWVTVIPASIYMLGVDPANAAAPVIVFSAMTLICVSYRRIIKRERVLWNRRLNERNVVGGKLREDFERAGRIEDGMKAKELSLINLYEITKKMSEDLRFDDIINAISVFLKENFEFRKCDLLIFRPGPDDLVVDREYALWHSPEPGVSVGRTDFDKLGKMFAAGFRDIYVTRSENPQTFADLRIDDPAVESVIAVPLLSEKRTVGMLVAQNLPRADAERFAILSMQFALELKKVLLYETVERMAITDSLTGLYVRRHFAERLEEELARSKRFGFKFAFLMLDIDDFKRTNDAYGHLVGDVVLKEISRVIKENVREIDIVARYGGEEMAIVLPETNRASALTVAQRLRKKIGESVFRAYDEKLRVTVSIGVSVYPDDAEDGAGMAEKADEALYAAKKSGKNVVCEWGKGYNNV